MHGRKVALKTGPGTLQDALERGEIEEGEKSDMIWCNDV